MIVAQLVRGNVQPRNIRVVAIHRVVGCTNHASRIVITRITTRIEVSTEPGTTAISNTQFPLWNDLEGAPETVSRKHKNARISVDGSRQLRGPGVRLENTQRLEHLLVGAGYDEWQISVSDSTRLPFLEVVYI